ncbi:MAG: ribosome small subunit-dependent GTPase A [candidate division Zixibacteria bacterium]|nr:ribosome small subunit-dependent GTPase A [candidate division Zixibacteria bacterium]
MNLENLGWNKFFENNFEAYKSEGYLAGRVSRENRGNYIVLSNESQMLAEISGKFQHNADYRSDYPAVGDWVVFSMREENRATIHAVLERKSKFTRQAVLSGGNPDGGGKTDEQVLAANIDTIFLVSGLDDDYNPRRIERFVSIAWDSGAVPVILLNKSDLCDDIESVITEVESVAFGVPTFAISAKDSIGLDNIHQYLIQGQTVAFLGSSGVGKSSIINCLFGEERLKTTEVRGDDSKGRHTTTHRELLVLPEGGIVIDTPGMRVIRAWSNDEGISRTFEDIEKLTGQCRFSDCKHQSEPGCAIQAGLSDGTISTKRYESYLKLQKEIAHLERRKDVKMNRQQGRDMSKRIRQHTQAVRDMRKKGLM